MKKSLFSVCLALCSLTLLTGCSKDDDDSSPETSDYAQLTAGTSWTYRSTEGTATPEIFTLTVANKDTVANQKTYKVITSSDGGPNNYMGVSGSNYYRFASFPSLGISSIEELYLKSDQAVNAAWKIETSFAIQGQTYNVTLNYSIKEKGISYTANSKVFNNVIHVRLDISLLGLTLGGGDFYYAEGVGMIESKIAVNPPIGQAYTSTQTLIAYEIK